MNNGYVGENEFGFTVWQASNPNGEVELRCYLAVGNQVVADLHLSAQSKQVAQRAIGTLGHYLAKQWGGLFAVAAD